MIIASEGLKSYIKMQMSIEKLADSLDISRQSLYNILDGKPISGKLISSILRETGFVFDKAFIVAEEK